MFLSAGSPELVGDHVDISFHASEGWQASGIDDMRMMSFAIGDAERGPMVGLVSITVRPGDEEKFPPIIHMHRSDSFRTIFSGDLYVGRELYANGAARLQEGGAYYGPEQPGPDSVRNTQPLWSVLVFGDKRGHRVHPADKKYLEFTRRQDEASDAFYKKLGIDKPLPDESVGETDIRTNLGVQIRAGHADLSFEQAGDWPQVGATRMAAMSIGQTDCGPLVGAISAAAGAVAAPKASWATEVVIMVINGSAVIGGRLYGPGDLRLQAADAPLPAIVAGAEGLDAYLIIGDRRNAEPAIDRADTGAVRWAREMQATFAPFAEVLDTREVVHS